MCFGFPGVGSEFLLESCFWHGFGGLLCLTGLCCCLLVIVLGYLVDCLLCFKVRSGGLVVCFDLLIGCTLDAALVCFFAS